MCTNLYGGCDNFGSGYQINNKLVSDLELRAHNAQLGTPPVFRGTIKRHEFPFRWTSKSIPNRELFQNHLLLSNNYQFPSPNHQMAPSRKSRKRASSDQLRELAKRNVRPAKGGSIAKKSHLESSGNFSQRSTPPAPPAPIDLDDSGDDDNSEYEQQGSATDIDEENMEVEEDEASESHRAKGHTNRQSKIHRDARMMAMAGSKHTVLMVVSGQPKVW